VSPNQEIKGIKNLPSHSKLLEIKGPTLKTLMKLTQAESMTLSLLKQRTSQECQKFMHNSQLQTGHPDNQNGHHHYNYHQER